MEIHPSLRKFFNMLWASIVSTGKFIIADQVTKYFIKSFLLGQQGYVYEVTSFFDLVYSWNHGISFGMFSENNQTANMIFIVLNSLITLYVWRLMLKSTNLMIYRGYGLIVGGAIGNIVDRIINGAVFDFLYFHIGNMAFPAFNLADSFIFIGVVVVIYDMRRESKAIAKEKEAEYSAEDRELAAAAERIRQLDAEIAKKNIQ